MKRNRHSVSFGLVVTTADSRVAVIERKLPYCVHNHLVDLRRRHLPIRFDRVAFERDVYPNLGPADKTDYDRYRGDLQFEDRVDFPHGQMQRRRWKSFRGDRLRVAFATAFKEFVEETGFKFNFDPEDVPGFPIRRVEFTGLDGYLYTQFYFLVRGVRRIRRECTYDFDGGGSPMSEEKLVYRGALMDLSEAYGRLLRQQHEKWDGKHLLLVQGGLTDLTTEEFSSILEGLGLPRNGGDT